MENRYFLNTGSTSCCSPRVNGSSARISEQHIKRREQERGCCRLSCSDMWTLQPLSPPVALEMSAQLMSKGKVSTAALCFHHMPAMMIVALAHAQCLDQDFERSGDFVEALRSYQRAAALGHAPACAVSAWLHINLMLGPGSRADEAHS
jgi:hypothetical protein